MKKVVAIGSKEIPMLANAASVILYKNVFHEDFLALMQKQPAPADLFVKMGFIFAKQGAGMTMKEVNSLSEDHFLEWLADFEPLDVLLASDSISELFTAQAEKTSDPKPQGE